MASRALAYTSLGHKVIYTSTSFLITRIPVLDCRILHLSIFLHNNLHHGSMKLVLVTHRSGTSLHIAYIRTLVSYDQSPFELTSSGRIDTEIARKLHRTADTLWNIHERAVTEYR